MIPALFLTQTGAHAREWLSPATVLYIFDHMLGEYRREAITRDNDDGNEEATITNDQITTCLLSKYDFYFMPLLNPDGYEYTHRAERFWRKNRRPFYSVEENR